MAYYAAILLVSIFLACWVCSIGNEVLGLVREDKEVTVTIEKKSTPAEVGEILKKEGVIDHPKVFELYCKLKKQQIKKRILFHITPTIKSPPKQKNQEPICCLFQS